MNIYSSIILFITIFALFHTNQCADVVIDDFNGEQSVIVVVSEGSTLPLSQFESFDSASILGGERDLQLTVTDSPTTSVTLSEVENNFFTISNGNQVQSIVVLQYDGQDNSSTLNPEGLGGLDFTTLSLADAFSFEAQVDTGVTSVKFLVTDMVGGSSTRSLNVASSSSMLTFTVPFAQFVGDVDWTDVGAVQLEFDLNSSSDFQFKHFKLAENLVPSMSVTPSPATRTPTPSPASQSRTPSPSTSGNHASSSKAPNPQPNTSSSRSSNNNSSNNNSSNNSSDNSSAANAVNVYFALFFAGLVFAMI